MNNNDHSGDDLFPAPKGKITVNGLSSFEGKYIMETGDLVKDDDIIPLIGYTVSNISAGVLSDPIYNLTKITNGKAEIPVYRIEVVGPTTNFIAYDGNDSVYLLSFMIFDSAEMRPMELGSAPVLGDMDIMEGRFSNGNITVNWDSEGGGYNPGVGGSAPAELLGKWFMDGNMNGTSYSETVNIGNGFFKCEDITNSEYFYFNITDWEPVGGISGYPNGYKLNGEITEQVGYAGAERYTTINIYLSDDNLSFVRTNSVGIVIERVYVKQS